MFIFTRVIIFIAATVYGFFILWLGGWDFDQRHPLLATFTLFITIIAALIAIFPFSDDPKLLCSLDTDK